MFYLSEKFQFRFLGWSWSGVTNGMLLDLADSIAEFLQLLLRGRHSILKDILLQL